MLISILKGVLKNAKGNGINLKRKKAIKQNSLIDKANEAN